MIIKLYVIKNQSGTPIRKFLSKERRDALYNKFTEADKARFSRGIWDFYIEDLERVEQLKEFEK